MKKINIDELPKVSILIPCYNSSSYLAEAIESAINQSWSNLEIIISDNNSTDDSVEIARRYAERDSRIKLLINYENIGPTKNWLNCAQHAEGEFVSLLFSDDTLACDYLKNLVPYLNDSSIGLVFCPAWKMDNNGEILVAEPMYSIGISGRFSSSVLIDHHLLLRQVSYPLSPGCAIFRKKDMLYALNYALDDSFKIDFWEHGAGQDLAIYLLTSMKYPYFYFLDKALVNFRSHGGNLSRLLKVNLAYALVKSEIASTHYAQNLNKLTKFRTAHLWRLFRINKISIYFRSMKWDAHPCNFDFLELAQYLLNKILRKLSRVKMEIRKDIPLFNRFSTINDLRIPGFEKNVPAGSVGQYDFLKRDTLQWYKEFFEKIISSQGKHFLPVYRMADGEFIFNVGRHTPFLRLDEGFFAIIPFAANFFVNKIRRFWGVGQLTCWGESYDRKNIRSLREGYVRSLRKVSQCGYLAIHFNRTNSQFSEEYMKPMCKWLDNSGVNLSLENYIPFYFVYALLCGPDGAKIIAEKNILVITHADDEKQLKIERSLIALGAKSVNHYQISQNNSMLDNIDPLIFLVKYDLILIAAGIGSVNILSQLSRSETVCIDAGIFIEILVNTNNRSRVFTVPDE